MRFSLYVIINQWFCPFLGIHILQKKTFCGWENGCFEKNVLVKSKKYLIFQLFLQTFFYPLLNSHYSAWYVRVPHLELLLEVIGDVEPVRGVGVRPGALLHVTRHTSTSVTMSRYRTWLHFCNVNVKTSMLTQPGDRICKICQFCFLTFLS